MTWYTPINLLSVEEEEVVHCWETTVIFIVSSFQYLILAAVFSKGRPYRKPFYTNIPFLIALVFLTIFSAVLALYPGYDLANFFQLMFDDEQLWIYFRLVLLGLALVNLFASYFVEMVIAESRQLKAICHLLSRKKGPKNRYKVIQKDMDNENWPNALLGPRESTNLIFSGIS
jgi:cation-transporting ATPase 13A2